MPKDKATAKREASRRCLVKKKAELANMNVDQYVKKHFKTTLEEYVTDAFHAALTPGKASAAKKTAPPKRDKKEPNPAQEEEESPPPVKVSDTTTVGQFLEQRYAKDPAQLKMLQKEVGKKVLAEQLTFGGNDMYLADLLNVNVADIIPQPL
jgi:hypothetical protein